MTKYVKTSNPNRGNPKAIPMVHIALTDKKTFCNQRITDHWEVVEGDNIRACRNCKTHRASMRDRGLL